MNTLEYINTCSTEQFIELFGEIFEHSPWIAQQAAEARPFASLNDVFHSMKLIVETSRKDQQLALIQEHPELGRRIKMSDASVGEQKGAGLDALSPEEFERISSLNARYTAAFQFPFIIAVAGKDKQTIMDEMERRLELTAEEEFQTAMQEIYKIALIRFNAITETHLMTLQQQGGI